MGKDNVKALKETRAEKLEELKLLYAKVQGEQRAVTAEEEDKIQGIRNEIESIDNTIKILDEMRAYLVEENKEKEEKKGKEGTENRAEAEEKAFAEYLRGNITEERAGELTFTDNGAVIPSSIADKVIKKINDICPVFSKATKYNVKGTIQIPFYPKDSDDIKMDYAAEFVELSSSTGKFDSISLTGFLAGVLTLISKSLVNNSHFDIVSFVVDHMAYNVSRWIEKECLIGTEGKIDGLSKLENGVKAASQTDIKADELIELQASVKDAYQGKALWIMNSKTRTQINKLKDGNGRYLLQDDATAQFGKTLLGKPIWVSDNMPVPAAGKTVIYYGDLSGLAIKTNESFNAQVLREKYATQHAIGVVGWLEMDAKVENEQKLAKLTMKE